MKQTVRQLGELCGISPRTLRYYHEIGLLLPCEITPAGYRLYGEAELERLQQILFFRELDFSLEEISAILNNPGFDRQTALAQHRSLLELRRARLNRLIALTKHALKGEETMSLKEFDMTEIEETRRKYADETRQRWGDSEAYAQSEARTAAYTKEDWAVATAEAETVYAAFIAAMSAPADSPASRQAVADWQEHITRRYYPCTNEILAGLGQMYVADERFTQNIDTRAPGLAAFMSQAIAAYCAK